MKTKTRLIYPTPDFPSMHSTAGKHPSEPLPLRWLEQLVADVRARIPTESERDSAVVYGADALRVTYTDELTPAEQMADELAELRAERAKLRDLFQADGTLIPGALEKLRKLAGV